MSKKQPEPKPTNPAPTAAAEDASKILEEQFDSLYAYDSDYGKAKNRVEQLGRELAEANAIFAFHVEKHAAVLRAIRAPAVATVLAGKPWDDGITKAAVGHEFKETFQGWRSSGVSDSEILTQLIKRLQWSSQVSLGAFRLQMAGKTLALTTWGGSESLATEKEIVADFRRVLNIPLPQAKPATKPAAAKPAAKPAPKVDKAKDVEAAAKSPKPAAAKPAKKITGARVFFKNGRWIAKYRGNDHTRETTLNATGEDIAVGELARLLKIAPAQIARPDRFATEASPPKSAGRPRVYEKEPGLWFVEWADGSVKGLRGATDLSSALDEAAALNGVHRSIFAVPEGSVNPEKGAAADATESDAVTRDPTNPGAFEGADAPSEGVSNE
jgi:hypothetical protein